MGSDIRYLRARWRGPRIRGVRSLRPGVPGHARPVVASRTEREDTDEGWIFLPDGTRERYYCHRADLEILEQDRRDTSS